MKRTNAFKLLKHLREASVYKLRIVLLIINNSNLFIKESPKLCNASLVYIFIRCTEKLKTKCLYVVVIFLESQNFISPKNEAKYLKSELSPKIQVYSPHSNV